MKVRPIVPRALANRDVETAVDHYLEQSGQRAALGFVAALERTYQRLVRHPDSGSPRYAEMLNLPGLRTSRLRRYPYLVFYMCHADRIDVWRVLHAQRDLPGWLREPQE